MRREVLLSFDIEEFDFPKERGQNISVKDGVAVSKTGTEKILKILNREKVKATFFVTGNFAKFAPEVVKQMLKDGHEVAAHGVDHFVQKKTDIKEAKVILEKVTNQKIVGWRQPRMQKIDYDELSRHGYLYDSSVNPAFIPGRYNNTNISRTPYFIPTKKTSTKRLKKQPRKNILEIPASTATFMRVPLFWLALHLFPFWLYRLLAKMSLKKTGLFVTYFHPWEFTDLSEFDIVPWYIKKNSNNKLEKRLEKLIKRLKKSGCTFIRFRDYQP